ncbi:MAG: DNA polymerase I, partial [Planctomycetaceae bacterium]
TSDKDIRQLISPQIKLYNCRKDAYFAEAELKTAWGIRPDQVIDFQSLVGDSVDNVPGVPLVGPKKAQALLEQFGTLEDVLAHADQAPGKKLRENLVKFADQARMSRELVTLQTNLPLDYAWDDARISEPDRETLFALFSRLGFGRMSEDYRPAGGEAERQNRTWDVVDTPDKFDAFLSELRKQKRFCFDLETTSLDELQADVVGWAFCWKPFHAYYVPVDGPAGDSTLDPADVLAALRPLLEDPQFEVVNQNIKYDVLVLRRAGVVVRGIGMDPMIGDYLLDAGARSHGLDHLAQKYLRHKMIPISDLIGKGKQQKMMFEVDVGRAAEYATEDADVALQLADRITQTLKDENLWPLYWDLERPLISVLADMEFAGVRIDSGELKRQSDELSLRLDDLMTEIYELAGREFNIGSPKQLADVLFEEHELHKLAEEQGIRAMKKTQKKTAWSTSHDVLEKLALFHDLPARIIDHRHLSKLKSTYLDALPEAVNPETGRVHTSFSQVVAATGRLSSTSPNLQNIPIRTAEGRRVRRAFIAGEPGWKLISADYSQIELRLLAHFSQDEALLNAFREGADIHASVAAEVFGVDPRDVTSDQRRVAKAVNFGVLYGQSAFGLSEQLRIPRAEAAAFIDDYFAEYTGVDR